MELPTARGPSAYHKLRFMFEPIGFLESCERAYGDAFRLKLGNPGVFVFSRPEHVRAIYTADPDVLRAGEAKKAIFGPLLGSASSLLLDGDTHVRRRRLLQPQFRGERMAPYSERIVRETQRAIERMPFDTFALLPHAQSLTLRVMLSALVGPEEPSTARLWTVLEHFATDAASSRLLMAPALQWDLGPSSPWGRVTRAVESARREVGVEVRRRRAEPSEPRDLLDLLLAATDEDGAHLSDDEVRDEVLTLVVAGHEITSMVLTWLVHAIVSRPEVYAHVLEESLSHGSDVVRMTYLDSVVRESMRLYSVVPFGSARIASRATRVGDYDVPRGAVVNVALHLLHRRPEIFDRPTEFVPERFQKEPHIGPYQWAPFGGGARRCVGMAFATFELKLIASTLLSSIDLRSVETPKPVRRGAFVAPANGLLVRAERRISRQEAA